MKKFRKLIPALCMLLVSALFVGTSTYASVGRGAITPPTGVSPAPAGKAPARLREAARPYKNKHRTPQIIQRS